MPTPVYPEPCANLRVSKRDFLPKNSERGSAKPSALCDAYLFIDLISIADALPRLWKGVSDLGILSSLCHPLLCLPVASCLTGLVPR